MLMPALLPQDLFVYSTCETEDSLFNLLVRKPQDFIIFFDYACDDETWSQKFADFMRKALTWITAQSFQGKLSGEFLQRAAQSIRAHFDNLHTSLPYNLIFKLEETSIKVNSALYSSASHFFADLVRRECFDKKNFKLEFPSVSYSEIFRFVEEYVNTGGVAGLWKLDQIQLLRILHYSTHVQMPGLSELCEEILSRYITVQNTFAMLSLAHQENLNKLKSACFHFINAQDFGIQLELCGQGTVGCQFIKFTEQAMDVFEKIRHLITHLLFKDDVPSNPHFGRVVRECPNLIALDISHTNYYTEYMTAVPSDLQELNVSACEWISAHYLKKIVELCPHLHKILLASNVQLTAHGWGELMRLRQLTALDITRCQQVRDEDFKIILHACGGVTELNVEDCKLISDRAFFELARTCQRLQKLNLSRTNIGDASIVEIISRCRNINTLDLTRCENITDKGVFELTRHGFNLQEINLTNCHVSKSTLEEIHKQRPMLKIVTNLISLSLV